MKLTCNVWRGNYDCVGFLVFINLGMEILSVKPGLVNTVLNIFRIVLFCKFFCHNFHLNMLINELQNKKLRPVIRTEIFPRYHLNSAPKRCTQHL